MCVTKNTYQAANEPVPEDVLFSQLTDLGIFPSTPQPVTINDIHPSFGCSIRSMLDLMLRQRYITKEKGRREQANANADAVANGQAQLFLYNLAEGADNDIGEVKIRDFLANVMSG